MKKLEKFQGKFFDKELTAEQLKKISGGRLRYSSITLSGCSASSASVDDCDDTDNDCPSA